MTLLRDVMKEWQTALAQRDPKNDFSLNYEIVIQQALAVARMILTDPDVREAFQKIFSSKFPAHSW